MYSFNPEMDGKTLDSYEEHTCFAMFISGQPEKSWRVDPGKGNYFQLKGYLELLLKRFGCDTSAAGFAISMDLLQEFHGREPEYDYDVLLLYSKDCDPSLILKMQKEISDSGECCVALCDEAEWMKYRRKIIVSSDGSIENE